MGKYFKYAIGEILLVVIGILIALQINNWNETRKKKALEQSYYCLLLEDIEQDKQQLLNLKTLTQERINGANKAIEEIQKKNTEIDIFGKNWLISVRLNTRTFQPNDGTYLDIKSSGNLNIIKDKRIIKQLNKYLKNVTGYRETILANVDMDLESINRIDNWFNIGLIQANMEAFYDNDVFTKAIRDKLSEDLPKSIPDAIKPQIYSAVVVSGINNRRRLELLSLIEHEIDIMQKLLQQKCNTND